MTNKILFVCISHTLTEAQREGWDFIVEASDALRAKTSQVSPLATQREVIQLAIEVIAEATACEATHIFMVGEFSLFFNVTFEARMVGITSVVATSERVSKDEVQPDGTVKKVSIFNHIGWRRV